MTDETEVPKITSVVKTPREKNPGRVAAGKRLALSAGTAGTEGTERTEGREEPERSKRNVRTEGAERSEATEGAEEHERSEEHEQCVRSSLPRDFKIYPPKKEKRFLMYSMDD